MHSRYIFLKGASSFSKSAMSFVVLPSITILTSYPLLCRSSAFNRTCTKHIISPLNAKRQYFFSILLSFYIGVFRVVGRIRALRAARLLFNLNLQALVDFPLALVSYNLEGTYLFSVGHVGPSIGLQIEAVYLDHPNFL